MRRPLAWALGTTILLSIFALSSTRTQRVVEAVDSRLREPAQGIDSSTPRRDGQPLPPLPGELPPLLLEAARRDLFAPNEPPRPEPKAEPAQPPVIAPAPAPTAPPMTYRFLGRMRAPDGKQLVYLVRGDAVLPVSEGLQLPDGYVVESITDEAVQLLYPPLNVRVPVPIPARTQSPGERGT